MTRKEEILASARRAIEQSNVMDRIAQLETETNELKQSLFMGRLCSKPAGRPRSTDRCPCGEMTKARAQKRGHVCEAKETK